MSAEDTGAPNLDAMARSELIAWTAHVRGNARAVARRLFPSRPRGYTVALALLFSYAENKSIAMGLRERAEIEQALRLEANCDALYKRLPKFARW